MEEHADPPMIVRSSDAGGFIRANRAFLAAVGYSEQELAAKPFADWLEPDDREALLNAPRCEGKPCRVRHATRDGGSLLLDVAVRDQGAGSVVLGRFAEGWGAWSPEDEAAPEATVKGTLHEIAQIIEEQNPGYKCSILLVAHGRFVSGAGPSLPDEYNSAIDGYAVGPTVGSCGTAIYWNIPVIVEDIQKDPLWAPFAELAQRAGVSACWSHPFASKGGRVLGALALYSPVPRAPTAEQLSRLRAAAQMTGLAVERGRAEEELRSANEVKARFMANMSHEIRTPLNALIGITDSLQDDPNDTHRDEVQLLRESSEHLLDLFTGVLELTEVQDRRHPGKPVNLRASIEGIHRSYESNARERGLRVDCSLADDVPEWALLDEWAFDRVFRLLLDNAVKFTDHGQVSIDVRYEDHKLLVRIADTGSGIDLDRLNELREPFVQGDLSTTKRHGGFGLGLALADLCLHALGGRLEFTPNETQGTIASFRIPISRSAAPADAALDARPAKQPTSLPVLVVEDNPVNTKVIEKLVANSGYECHLSANGEEALRAIEKNSYSCVLMDCQMPVMDGYEATRRIRATEGESGVRLPIIAVTANALAEDRERCLQAGMDDYLKKPVRKDQLVAALNDHAGSPAT